ncbi:MAG: PCRF domain-containing protein, partial [Candidatus Thioglobus sp.]|nr:PCRF domain-containing protein [Candidatus Thioglobus sp.]
MELSSTYQQIEDLRQRAKALSKHLNLEEKQSRLEEVLLEIQNPNIWSKPEQAQSLGQEKSKLEAICQAFQQTNSVLTDAKELLDLAQSENDETAASSLIQDLNQVESEIKRLEFERMFSGELDANSAYL